MGIISVFRSSLKFVVVFAVVASIIPFAPVTVFAQGALEEIVVTAQRREQSLQEVPIALEIHTGRSIQDDGFRNIVDLGVFSPGLVVTEDQSEGGANTFIRGFGTAGRNLTVVQSAPTFVDKLHQSRVSQSLMAFLDVGQVEVLKGPQPVHFGQNAEAGAINIVSAKPTANWEGYAVAEAGYFGHPTSFRSIGNYKAEAAIGGPLTDTVGIRVAGKFETSDGHLKDIISRAPVGYYNTMGGRVIVDWTPTDNFRAETKFEIAEQTQEPEALHVCRIEGPARFPRQGAAGIDINDPDVEGRELSVWLPYPQGSGTEIPHEPLGECYESENALPTAVQMAPPWYVRGHQNGTGALDIRAALDGVTRDFYGSSRSGATPREDLKPWTLALDLSYTLDNGITVNSTTGYQAYVRNVMRPNRYLPFIQNVHHREEDLGQWSSELRIQSPTGGRIEWQAGAFWQDENVDLFMRSFRNTTRQGHRENIIDQESRWLSAFGTFTFNFTDQLAIEIGGRYTDAKVITDAFALDAGQWVFDVEPCAAGDDDWRGVEFADVDTATCTLADGAIQIDAADVDYLLDDAPGGIDRNNLWYLEWRENRDIPSTWRSPLNAPVGMVMLPGAREGDDGDHRGVDSSDTGFDPQIILSYQPSPNMNLYAKYATAWKVGGIDTGVGGIPADITEISFDSESASIFEGGAKGSYLDGRGQYDVAIYQMTFTDLQTGTDTPDPDDPTLSINIGEQRSRGIEFGTQIAVSDQLRVGLAAAFMDAEMVDFPNAGCTAFEFANAAQTGCDVDTETIDRSGQDAAYSPKFSGTANIDYWMPVLNDQFRFNIGATARYKTEYFTDTIGFSKSTTTPAGADMNLNVGIGDINDVWRLTLSGRNLFEHRPQYNAERDLTPEGIQVSRLSKSATRSFALQLRYNFQ